ncbi:host cell division inhibitor Icd-like protein [Rahnella variigena]|uniref:Ash-like/host cell division inhibitor Icd-like protein n=1 Tax=Rahnella variigena TaxID=574964 RepID=A0ABX9PVU7_9GAMM|nr:host cell division inhibitor Icd-like protein [Rahnella variigena]RJT55864.1 host cell division inhibitor Icd-like protein [Rahnella variigena]RKF68346.1 Ash-like/host cell division inhibitor Icd-like protein [Rahnella variigena]
MIQKRLFSGEPLLYSFCAAAKSAAGRGNPSLTMATQHAPCVFFYVAALAHLLSAQWFLNRCAHQAMVAQAGQPSGWPVYIVTGISTPVWATTHKRGNFGGSCNQLTMEANILATALASLHPKFTFLFAAVRRAEPKAPICMLRSAADNEHSARRQFARDYVLCFAGRLPAQEAA